MVTSTVGHEARAYWGAYAVSKAGLEMMTKVYAGGTGQVFDQGQSNRSAATRTGICGRRHTRARISTVKTPEETTDTFVELALPTLEAQGQTFTLQREY